jgi:hypothetical protein
MSAVALTRRKSAADSFRSSPSALDSRFCKEPAPGCSVAPTPTPATVSTTPTSTRVSILRNKGHTVSVASQARVGGARLRRHCEVVGWLGRCAGQHLDESFSLRQKAPRSISRPGRGTSDNDAADDALVAGLRRWESSERALEGDECPDRSESGPRAVSSSAGAGRSEGKRCEGLGFRGRRGAWVHR